MALLSKLVGFFSFFLSRQSSDGEGCSSIQEEPIQRPPEDTDIKEEMDSEDRLVELEISPDFSSAAEPLMVPVEETESQTPHGVEIFPRSCTVAKPSLIQVAPLHSLPWFLVQEAHAEEEILPFVSTVAEPLMAQFEDPEKELPSFFTEVAEPPMVQEAPWHLTPPSEEEKSFCTVAETLMVQMARAELEQEHPPQRRKKERQTYSYTIKLPGASPPPTPKHAWIDVSPAEDTKAGGDMIKEKREFEDETLVMEMESVEIVDVDLRQERRMKKERKIASIGMDGDSAKATHTKTRQDEKRRPERRAKVEDRKTEQASAITPAKGEKTHVQELESSSKISQKSSRKQNALLLICEMLQKKVTALREKKKIRREEKKKAVTVRKIRQ
ncbi:uncharacterized protein LOC120463931 [Pimephales promelas]|uniref:uncharacterized protein LOC120463931 n=1 Tax=Pimephales promelas TaxID=90988 RepID=UPI001955CC8C|nr:uncharacterized protein LOC120463931 [Pimephales promelas]KAG1936001.1 hypothetical protein F2P79_018922 [Pimephales promelas]